MDDRFRRADFRDDRLQCGRVKGRDQEIPHQENKFSRHMEFSTCYSVKTELITPDSPEQIRSPDAGFEDSSSYSSRFFSSNQPKTYSCRLCNNDTFFKTETDFDIHLTVIHFREKLMKKIQVPFRCLSCGYVPLETMTLEDQSDDLLMHYGCKEHFSQMYYKEKVSRLPQLAVHDKEPEAISILCKLCSTSFDTERLFVRHISLRHFPKQLCDDLPKSEPFICPFIDCGQEKFTIHNLMLHYGCEHNISMELYQKETKSVISKENIKTEVIATPSSSTCSPFFANYLQKVASKRSSSYDPLSQAQMPISSPAAAASSSGIIKHKPNFLTSRGVKDVQQNSPPQYSCDLCPEKNLKFSAKKSLNYHILFSHFFTDLPSTGPCECPVCFGKFSIKHVFANHFLEKHFDEYIKDKLGKKETTSSSKVLLHHIKTSSKDKTSSKPEESSRDKEKRNKISSEVKEKFSSSKSGSREESKEKPKSSSRSSGESKEKSSSSSTKTKSHSSSRKSGTHVSSKHSSSSSRSKSNYSSSRSKEEEKATEPKQASSSPTSVEKASDDEAPIPACRVRKTVHTAFARPVVSSGYFPSAVSARQKMTENWKKDSIDSQRFEIEQLKEKIQEMERSHAEALKKKAEEFERWITQKEKALEEEHDKRKQAETKLEEGTVANAETEMQLVQQKSNNKALEAELDDKSSLYDQVLADKKRLEKEAIEGKEKMTMAEVLFEEKAEELKNLQESFQEKLQLICNMEEDMKELKSGEEKLKEEHEKQTTRLEKSVETHQKKVEKLTEEKKAKISQIKELTKKMNDKETELSDKVTELTKQNKQLNIKIATQKTALEKSVKSEMKRLEKDHDKIGKQLEEYEGQLQEQNNTIERLELRKDGLLDSLLHIQKIMQGFEALISDKNEKLQEQENKIADIENILEESVDKVNHLKVVEKDKKDLAKQVKQLQLTLQDWETRQFTNVKLISGLEKTKVALEKKVKDFEENHTGAEEELYEMSSQIRKHEKEIKRLKEVQANTDTEHSMTKTRLQTKTEELTTANAKIEDLEHQIRDLEREIRDKSNASEEVQQLKQNVSNKEAELAHLRLSLNNLKIQFNQIKSHSTGVEAQLSSLKTSNGKFETEYSIAVSQIETLKKALKDALAEVARKDEQLLSLRETVRKDTSTLSTMSETNSSNMQQVNQIVASLNQYLNKDDTTRSTSGFVVVKTEPTDDVTDPVDHLPPQPTQVTVVAQPPASLPSVQEAVRVDTDRQIVMNVPGSFALAEPIKDEPLIPNPDTFGSEDIADHSDEDVSDPTRFNFYSTVPFVMSPAVSVSPALSVSDTSQKNSGKKRTYQLPDYTGQHFPDEDTIVCGICLQFDPPATEANANAQKYTTEWVGCDCDRWFHKPCTRLKRFTSLFSCRSVRMKCLGGHHPPKAKKAAKRAPEPEEEIDDINMTIVHR